MKNLNAETSKINNRGAVIKLFGVILIILGGLNSMLAWRGGFALGFVVVALTAAVLTQITHEHAGSRTLGVFVTAVLLLDPGYRSELLGARSMPLAALFLFTVFLLLFFLNQRLHAGITNH